MSESSAILAAMYEGNTDALAALLAARPELDIFEAAAVGDAARIRQLVRARPTLIQAVSGVAHGGRFKIGRASCRERV